MVWIKEMEEENVIIISKFSKIYVCIMYVYINVCLCV